MNRPDVFPPKPSASPSGTGQERKRGFSLLRFRFSLGTLFVFVALCAVLLAWWQDRLELRGKLQLAESSSRQVSAQNKQLAAELRQRRAQTNALDQRLWALTTPYDLSPERVEVLLDVIRHEGEPNRFHTLGPRAREDLFRADPGEKELVPLLIAELDDDRVANTALTMLASIGPTAVPALATALQDTNPKVRAHAAHALRDMFSDAAPAAGALAKALEDEDATVQELAAAALSVLGPDAVEAMPALVEAMADPITRHHAKEALWKIGEAAREPLQIALEKHADPAVRVGAAGALARSQFGAPPDDAVVSQLLAAADSDDPQIRREAAEDLRWIAGSVPDAITRLIGALRDRDAPVRQAAAESLALLGEAAHAAVPALTEALGDENPEVRSRAARALARIGPPAEAAIPALRANLEYDFPDQRPRFRDEHDARLRVRLDAAAALVQLTEDSEEAYEMLAAAIRSSERWRVVPEVFGAMGARAKVFLPVLLEVLANTDWPLDEAVPIVGEIGPQASAAVPYLILLAAEGRREGWALRALPAVEALAKIGPEARDAVLVLISIIQFRWGDGSDRARFQSAAMRALANIGPEARAAEPWLIQATQWTRWEPPPIDRHLERRLRLDAAAALLSIGSDDPAAVTALQGGLQDQSAVLRMYALEIVDEHDVDHEAIGLELVDKVKNDRHGSVRALAERVFADTASAGERGAAAR